MSHDENGQVDLNEGEEDITSARKLLTNRSYGVSYHLCSG